MYTFQTRFSEVFICLNDNENLALSPCVSVEMQNVCKLCSVNFCLIIYPPKDSALVSSIFAY